MPKQGKLTVVCGGMCSGKTEELVRRVKRAMYARQEVMVFKPKLDNRYADKEVVTHEGQKIAAIPIDEKRPQDILEKVRDTTKLVCIDEGQFFAPEIVDVANELAGRGYDTLVCCLDLDFQGNPFGPAAALMATAEEVKKKHAVCLVCGAEASRSRRISGGDAVVELGALDQYEPRCRRCFRKGL